MKLKRLFILILSLCLVVFALSACGSKDELSSESPEQTASANDEQTSEEPDENEAEMIETIYLTIENHKISVKLEENDATKALIELLKEGDIIYTAHDYGGFEKVGNLGHTLPRSDRHMATEAGDVTLYSGNQIVLFYGSNSWSYTKLGTMQNISAEELRQILTETDPLAVQIGLR